MENVSDVLRFIGMDLNPDYIKLGFKRIEKEASQTKLFTGE